MTVGTMMQLRDMGDDRHRPYEGRSSRQSSGRTVGLGVWLAEGDHFGAEIAEDADLQQVLNGSDDILQHLVGVGR